MLHRKAVVLTDAPPVTLVHDKASLEEAECDLMEYPLDPFARGPCLCK
jgi:hypothetical protein